MVVDRGVSWDKALELYQQHMSDHGEVSQESSRGSGFYCSRREQFHQHLHLLALEKENSAHLFNIVRCGCVVTTFAFNTPVCKEQTLCVCVLPVFYH